MPTGHKIALFGIGRIGRLIYSGVDALSTTKRTGTDNGKDFFEPLTKVINEQDYKSLVNSYKKVKRKYYPDKDMLIKK